MAYTIQALIADETTLRGADLLGARLVSLPQQKAMLPLTTEVSEQLGIPFLPITYEGPGVPDSLNKLGCLASRDGLVAYVEAEFFGGLGGQASVLWDRGSIAKGPIVAKDAINQALRILGVNKGGAHDEFDALGLDKHRDTDDWSGESAV